MPKWSFLVSILLGLMSTVAYSMRFDLQSGATKCISDDIKTNAMTVGKYSVVNLNDGFPVPESHKITVRVFQSKPKFSECVFRFRVYCFFHAKPHVNGLFSLYCLQISFFVELLHFNVQAS